MKSARLSDGMTTAEILREAIDATGGPASGSVAGVRNYIDRRHSQFPWGQDWPGEICGAKAALGSMLDPKLQDTTGPSDVSEGLSAHTMPFPRLVHDNSEPETMAEPTSRLNEICAAREFVERIGEGSLERASVAQEYLAGIEPSLLSRLGPAIETWNEILATVGGNEAAAESILRIIAERILETAPDAAGNAVHSTRAA